MEEKKKRSRRTSVEIALDAVRRMSLSELREFGARLPRDLEAEAAYLGERLAEHRAAGPR